MSFLKRLNWGAFFFMLMICAFGAASRKQDSSFYQSFMIFLVIGVPISCIFLFVNMDAKPAKKVITGKLPLNKKHMCFKNGHNMFKLCEKDNGRSIFGTHKCSKCGYEEDFQYDY